jgi:hypothetical protein
MLPRGSTWLKTNRRRELMPKVFRRGYGDWTQYRSKFNLSRFDEVDLHFGKVGLETSYDDAMADVISIVEGSLKKARERGRQYLMFIHGYSTSRRGKTTARSQVRKFMRSSDATPFIERKHCIQHQTVFVAKIRHPSTPDEYSMSVNKAKNEPSPPVS